MKRISQEIIERTRHRIDSMNPAEAPQIVSLMSQEQPVLLAYLLSAGEEDFNEEEKELLLYAGIMIWQIMKEGAGPLPPVSEGSFLEAENRNTAMLEYLDLEPERDFRKTIRLIFENYNQLEVLKFAIQLVLEEEDPCPIREDNRGLMIYYLKNVIDSFEIENRRSNSTGP